MVIAAIAGYLIGAFPLERPARAWFGRRAEVAVVVTGVVKGALAAIVGALIWGPWWTAHVAILLAMVGQIFPLIARRAGGLGITAFVGGMLVVAPIPMVIGGIVGLLVFAVLRLLHYGLIAAAVVFSLSIALAAPGHRATAALMLVAVIIVRFIFARIPPPVPANEITTTSL